MRLGMQPTESNAFRQSMWLISSFYLFIKWACAEGKPADLVG